MATGLVNGHSWPNTTSSTTLPPLHPDATATIPPPAAVSSSSAATPATAWAHDGDLLREEGDGGEIEGDLVAPAVLRPTFALRHRRASSDDDVPLPPSLAARLAAVVDDHTGGSGSGGSASASQSHSHAASSATPSPTSTPSPASRPRYLPEPPSAPPLLPALPYLPPTRSFHCASVSLYRKHVLGVLTRQSASQPTSAAASATDADDENDSASSDITPLGEPRRTVWFRSESEQREVREFDASKTLESQAPGVTPFLLKRKQSSRRGSLSARGILKLEEPLSQSDSSSPPSPVDSVSMSSLAHVVFQTGPPTPVPSGRHLLVPGAGGGGSASASGSATPANESSPLVTPVSTQALSYSRAMRLIYDRRTAESSRLLSVLQKGAVFRKYQRRGNGGTGISLATPPATFAAATVNYARAEFRFFYVNKEASELKWTPLVRTSMDGPGTFLIDGKRHKPKSESLFHTHKSRALADCLRVFGDSLRSPHFTMFNTAGGAAWLGMSLVFLDRTLDLVALSEQQAREWFAGLQGIVPLNPSFKSAPMAAWHRLRLKVQHQAKARNVSVAAYVRALVSRARLHIETERLAHLQVQQQAALALAQATRSNSVPGAHRSVKLSPSTQTRRVLAAHGQLAQQQADTHWIRPASASASSTFAPTTQPSPALAALPLPVVAPPIAASAPTSSCSPLTSVCSPRTTGGFNARVSSVSRSPRQPPPAVSLSAALLADVLEMEAPSPAARIGHSYGGLTGPMAFMY